MLYLFKQKQRDMRFLIFLINIFTKLFNFICFIIVELMVFYLILYVLYNSGLDTIALITKIVFVLWIIAEILMMIFIDGFKGLIRYIIKR